MREAKGRGLTHHHQSGAAQFEWTSEYLGSQPFYHPRDPVESYREAVRTYLDCLIARIAVERGLALLHDDRDFEKMAGVVPDLILA